MGLIPTYCRALIMLHKRVGFKDPLLTLGNQDVWANCDQLKTFFDEIGCRWVEAVEAPHTSNLFKQNPLAKDFVHARTFFEMMGLEEYYDIDKFEIDAPQILHDLNSPVPPELCDRFNLIIDGGTIEHIFDVRQVFENIVRMCRKSGWVVHITPSSNYVDHGFYSLSPCVFYDYYDSNGFGDFVCYIFLVDPNDFFGRSSYIEYSYGMDLTKLIDPNKITAVFFAAQKLRSQELLVIPTQGAYRPKLQIPKEQPETNEVCGTQPESQFISLTERLVPAFLTPYLKPIRPFLGNLSLKIKPAYKRLRKM